jgi:hypothetical protein
LLFQKQSTRIPKMKILAPPLLVRMATLWEWANMLFGYLYAALGGTPEPQTASRQGLLVESAIPRSHAARGTWCTTSWNHGGGWWELARWIGSAFEKILGHLRLKSSVISPILSCVRISSSFLRWPQILHWWAGRSARVICGKCASLPDEVWPLGSSSLAYLLQPKNKMNTRSPRSPRLIRVYIHL